MENIELLEQKVEIKMKGILSRRKIRYHLAKDLGLTSEMAGIVCGWSEARIRTMASEYQAKQAKEPVSVA